jgi:chemotaxis protein MotB
MFALGSSKPNEQTRNLVQLVTRVVDQLPNKISISGHTDAVPYRSQEGYTN